MNEIWFLKQMFHSHHVGSDVKNGQPCPLRVSAIDHLTYKARSWSNQLNMILVVTINTPRPNANSGQSYCVVLCWYLVNTFFYFYPSLSRCETKKSSHAKIKWKWIKSISQTKVTDKWISFPLDILNFEKSFFKDLFV